MSKRYYIYRTDPESRPSYGWGEYYVNRFYWVSDPFKAKMFRTRFFANIVANRNNGRVFEYGK